MKIAIFVFNLYLKTTVVYFLHFENNMRKTLTGKYIIYKISTQTVFYFVNYETINFSNYYVFILYFYIMSLGYAAFLYLSVLCFGYVYNLV